MSIEAIANPEISLKTRERDQKNLNDTFRIALRLDSFMKINCSESKPCRDKNMQGVQGCNDTELILQKLDEALNKQTNSKPRAV